MTYDPDGFVSWFESYTRRFMGESAEDDVNLMVKVDHTRQVLELAKEITHALELDGPLAELAHLAALFHDVGRFPQYARFRTYNDRISINHARLGVETLRREGVLSDCRPEHRRLILGAVYLHNRRSIPDSLPSRLSLLTRIVRDADKLDIMRVILGQFEPGARANGVVTLGLKPHPTAYSASVLAKVQKWEMVPYEELIWVNDLKLFLCSWAYDLNFPASRRILVRERHLEGVFGCLPETPELRALQERMRSELLNHPDVCAWPRAIQSTGRPGEARGDGGGDG